MRTSKRQRARVVPPTPITVAIDDQETGLCLCYGVIANVSESGACVWTNGELATGARLVLRVSFAHPPEVHEISGTVVWASAAAGDSAVPATQGLRRFGVEWLDSASPCIQRLRQVALHALQEALTPSGPLPAIRRTQLER